ncbi:MAG: hypothetical protein IT428_20720 [Planctomycetaceae bacterium]|nr:hypothetical protein [Planctomycetaceae bacterium]
MPSLNPIAMGRILSEYPPPRSNVVLLSCMDLRLVDELASFMDRDNLTNRYDHLIMAGAALGVMRPGHDNWRSTFFEHLDIALKVHWPVEDIYILEHRSCGAYAKFLDAHFGDSPKEQARELKTHREYASQLAEEIQAWAALQTPINEKPVRLNVRSFLMDLRGDIELLGYHPARPTASASKNRKNGAAKTGKKSRRATS